MIPIGRNIISPRQAWGKVVIALAAGCLLFFIFNWFALYFFNTGLRNYYCLKPAKILCIGHSMSEMGIDRDLLESTLGVPVAKYCMNGAGTFDRLIMIQHYLETVKEPPELIVYDVSGRSFSSGLATNSYALFFPFMDESEAVDSYLRSAASPEEYWQKKLIPLSRYDDTRLGAVVRGWRHDWKNRSLKKFDPASFQHDLDTGHFWRISFDEDNLKRFEDTLTFLNQKNIRLLLVGFPCVDMLNRAEPEKYEHAMEIFHSAAKRYSNVSFLDLNAEFSHQYELFGDPIHLRRNGQIIVTERLAEYLNMMRKQSQKPEPDGKF